MNERYSNREIDTFFKSVMETLKSIKETVDGVDDKLQYTNGKIATVKAWKEQVVGAGKLALLVVLPILSWALWQISQIDAKIQDGVKTVLSTYDKVRIEQ